MKFELNKTNMIIKSIVLILLVGCEIKRRSRYVIDLVMLNDSKD